MKISYAITVCNERVEIETLLTLLFKSKQPQDEVVVLFDSKNGSQDVLDYLNTVSDKITLEVHEFNNHFATWKNILNQLCTGDYIFNIDADELPDGNLIASLHDILQVNSADAFWVPRINIVEGITENHIKQWGWTISPEGWINWPHDSQLRIYKNTPKIKWEGGVHERVLGYSTVSRLPDQQEYALWHIKNIERQEKQNQYYDTL